MTVVLMLILMILVLAKPKRTDTRKNPKIFFCDRGMDGHNERVAQFYGFDNYKDMMKAEGFDIDEIERKIENGELKMVSVNFQDWLDSKGDE